MSRAKCSLRTSDSRVFRDPPSSMHRPRHRSTPTDQSGEAVMPNARPVRRRMNVRDDDGGTVLTARQAASAEAEQAARAGAGALSVDALRAGQIQIDGPAAVATAEQFMITAGHPGTAVVVGGVVTVRIDYQVPTAILGLIGFDRLDVSAAAAAVNVGGVTRGSP